jgi:hypothetical protein
MMELINGVEDRLIPVEKHLHMLMLPFWVVFRQPANDDLEKTELKKLFTSCVAAGLLNIRADL